MPKGKDQLKLAMRGYTTRKKTVVVRYTGVLGIITGGNRVVDIPNRSGFVWVRLRTVSNEVIQAYNETVSSVYDLPVIVERDKEQPNRYRIISRDVERYQNWPSNSAYLPAHGNSHSFNRDDSGTAGDVAWVFSQQILPFLIMPSGTYGAANVLINPYNYLYGGSFHYAGNTGTESLLPYKPADNSKARMLLVYLDKPTGNFPIATGTLTEFDNSITGTADIMQYIPAPPANAIPLAGVRLVSGTATIKWDNIYDIRQFLS